jgi:hypothetical protein
MILLVKELHADVSVEAALPTQSRSSSDFKRFASTRPLPTISNDDQGVSRNSRSHASSRVSIERYLSAPLEQEPASIPAINAALKIHKSQSRSLRPRAAPRGQHSRESSFDVTSEGRRTFYTSGSAPDSSGTSYSTTSRANHRQRSESHPVMPDIPRYDRQVLASARVQSPERPTTGRTVDTEKTWTEQMEMIMPGYSPSKAIDYKVKAEIELARIQEKAKLLEGQMKRYKEKGENETLRTPRITDEMAYARMAEKPKLAWILGGDVQDAKSIKRPKSSGSLGASATYDTPGRPSFSETLVKATSSKAVRKSKSSSALDEKARQSMIKEKTEIVERKANKRSRFYCTFCQKRFQSRADWMRHEQTMHMPEELWICCPRTGQFPSRCPFCEKTDPSPSHLADHNYLSCQEKPLSERTFNRKDYFLQHASQEHKISLEQKPARLVELLEAWRHPMPLARGHQALHCGFCGLTFPTYQDRSEHVAGHFMAGLDMMSWWPARISHEIVPFSDPNKNPYVTHFCSEAFRTDLC